MSSVSALFAQSMRYSVSVFTQNGRQGLPLPKGASTALPTGATLPKLPQAISNNATEGAVNITGSGAQHDNASHEFYKQLESLNALSGAIGNDQSVVLGVEARVIKTQFLSLEYRGNEGAGTIAARHLTSIVSEGDNDTIAALNSLSIDATKGANVNVTAHTFIDAGAGSDVIIASNNLQVSNNQSDDINAILFNHVDAGEGNDVAVASNRAHLYGGEGNDILIAASNSHLNGEDGDDIVIAVKNSISFGGKGDDLLIAAQNSHANGDEGNDTIYITGGHAHGGEGDDIIYANGTYTQGGYGNDIINIGKSGGYVHFGKGDGKDVINASGNFTLSLGYGFSTDGISIKRNKGKIVISFKGSDDQLTINLAPGTKFKLNLVVPVRNTAKEITFGEIGMEGDGLVVTLGPNAKSEEIALQFLTDVLDLDEEKQDKMSELFRLLKKVSDSSDSKAF